MHFHPCTLGTFEIRSGIANKTGPVGGNSGNPELRVVAFGVFEVLWGGPSVIHSRVKQIDVVHGSGRLLFHRIHDTNPCLCGPLRAYQRRTEVMPLGSRCQAWRGVAGMDDVQDPKKHSNAPRYGTHFDELSL